VAVWLSGNVVNEVTVRNVHSIVPKIICDFNNLLGKILETFLQSTSSGR